MTMQLKSYITFCWCWMWYLRYRMCNCAFWTNFFYCSPIILIKLIIRRRLSRYCFWIFLWTKNCFQQCTTC